MNKKIIISLIAIVILVAIWVAFNNTSDDQDQLDIINAVTTPEETNINEDRDDIIADQEIATMGEVADDLELDNLAAGDTVSPGFVIEGSVPGQWFFEATAPYQVVNWDGLIIGEGYIQAVDDWMTTDPVPFSGVINYNLPANTPNLNGTLILQRQNASGLPENDASVEIPITLSL